MSTLIRKTEDALASTIDAPNIAAGDIIDLASLPNKLFGILADQLVFDSGAVPADAAGVDEWRDALGPNIRFLQTTAGYQPLYQAAEVNGRAVVQFDGTDDLLAGNNPSKFISIAGGLTVYAAARHVGGSRFFQKNNSISAEIDTLGMSAAGGLLVGNAFVNGTGFSDVASYDDKWTVFSATYDHSQKEITNYINGGLRLVAGGVTDGTHSSGVITVTTQPVDNQDPIYVGNRWDRGNGLNGSIYALLFFKGIHSTDTRQKIEGQLAHDLGIRSSLASAHPYYLA